MITILYCTGNLFVGSDDFNLGRPTIVVLNHNQGHAWVTKSLFLIFGTPGRIDETKTAMYNIEFLDALPKPPTHETDAPNK